MSDDEFYAGLRMIKYFWDKKGDVTRWTGYEAFKLELKRRRPDLLFIIENYLKAQNVMTAAIQNL